MSFETEQMLPMSMVGFQCYISKYSISPPIPIYSTRLNAPYITSNTSILNDRAVDFLFDIRAVGIIVVFRECFLLHVGISLPCDIRNAEVYIRIGLRNLPNPKSYLVL